MPLCDLGWNNSRYSGDSELPKMTEVSLADYTYRWFKGLVSGHRYLDDIITCKLLQEVIRVQRGRIALSCRLMWALTWACDDYYHRKLLHTPAHPEIQFQSHPIPIPSQSQSTYRFGCFKPFYGNLNQLRQTI